MDHVLFACLRCPGTLIASDGQFVHVVLDGLRIVRRLSDAEAGHPPQARATRQTSFVASDDR